MTVDVVFSYKGQLAVFTLLSFPEMDDITPETQQEILQSLKDNLTLEEVAKYTTVGEAIHVMRQSIDGLD